MVNTSKVLGALAALAIGSASVAFAAEKLNIEKVMEKAFKGKQSLFVKVSEGNASDAQKKEFLDYAKALADNKPPKGDEAHWKKLTTAITAAAEDVAAGKEGAAAALKAAVNCKGCHAEHQPD